MLAYLESAQRAAERVKSQLLRAPRAAESALPQRPFWAAPICLRPQSWACFSRSPTSLQSCAKETSVCRAMDPPPELTLFRLLSKVQQVRADDHCTHAV